MPRRLGGYLTGSAGTRGTTSAPSRAAQRSGCDRAYMNCRSSQLQASSSVSTTASRRPAKASPCAAPSRAMPGRARQDLHRAPRGGDRSLRHSSPAFPRISHRRARGRSARHVRRERQRGRAPDARRASRAAGTPHGRAPVVGALQAIGSILSGGVRAKRAGRRVSVYGDPNVPPYGLACPFRYSAGGVIAGESHQGCHYVSSGVGPGLDGRPARGSTDMSGVGHPSVVGFRLDIRMRLRVPEKIEFYPSG